MSRRAITHLRKADPVLGRIIDHIGPYRPTIRTEGKHFDAVLRAIVFQQLSGKAASTIHGRLLGLYGGRSPTPEELLATPDAMLRGAGLSTQKTRYARDLATRAASGALPIDRLHELSDAEVLEALVAVKGVGKWTAQMFLMFRLGRENVLPDLDLGIRKAVQLAYGMRTLPTPEQVIRRGASWSPYASVAAWYLWRTLDDPNGAWVRAPAKKKKRATVKRAGAKPATIKRRGRSR